LCFGYKNPEKENQNLRIKISRTENNTFQKKLSEIDYCVPEKGIRNVILYVPYFYKCIFGFSPMIACNDMVRNCLTQWLLLPVIYQRQFLHAPLHFSSCTPQCYAKTKLSLLFFKNPKLHLNCIYFFAIWIMESRKISDWNFR